MIYRNQAVVRSRQSQQSLNSVSRQEIKLMNTETYIAELYRFERYDKALNAWSDMQ